MKKQPSRVEEPVVNITTRLTSKKSHDNEGSHGPGSPQDTQVAEATLRDADMTEGFK